MVHRRLIFFDRAVIDKPLLTCWAESVFDLPERDSLVDIAQLEFAIREELNKTSPRVMGVLRPLRVVIENYPEGESEELEASFKYLVLGTIGSILAGISGWYWAAAEGFEAPFHRWLGLATTAFALASCLLAWQRRDPDSEGGRSLYRVALLLTAILLVLAGHAGGDLTFGRDHYVAPW